MPVTQQEFMDYQLVVEDAIKKTDANFVAIVEILGEKGIFDEEDVIRIKRFLRPRILAILDQTIQEKKDGKEEGADDGTD